jgi:phosphate transport system permease protein
MNAVSATAPLPVDTLYRPRLARRRILGRLFAAVCLVLTLAGLGFLAVLLVQIVQAGWDRLDLAFLQRLPSFMNPERGGVRSALWGSIWLLATTTLTAVPLGVSAAVYLQEYARPSRLTRFIHLNIANLAGVPSVVYGILGLAVFVRWMVLDRSVLAGGLTLALLVLPVIIIAAREALAAVPESIRHAAFALGATRWQVVRHHVLPSALPGIMTGVILSVSRAIGEAAPILVVGAVAVVPYAPQDRFDPAGGISGTLAPLSARFTALPIQVFNWSGQPQAIFHELAAAGIIVLLALLLTMNAVAIGIRTWQLRNKTW